MESENLPHFVQNMHLHPAHEHQDYIVEDETKEMAWSRLSRVLFQKSDGCIIFYQL